MIVKTCDVGGSTIKAGLIEVPAGKILDNEVISWKREEGLERLLEIITQWRRDYDYNSMSVAIPVSHRHGVLQRSKICGLSDMRIDEFRQLLEDKFGKPTFVCHDATASHRGVLFQQPECPESSLLIGLGTSIAVSIQMFGRFIESPYNSWPHVQIVADNHKAPVCDVCKLESCFRTLYQTYRMETDSLSVLVARFICNIINPVPVHSVYLAGGVIEELDGLFESIQQAMNIGWFAGPSVLKKAPQAQFSGALGAALLAEDRTR